MSFVWGISGIDRSGYDIDFDIYPAANQNKLVSFCNSVLTEVCTDESGAVLSGCSSPGGRLVRSNTMECFMTEFQQWHQNMFAVASTDASVNRSTFMTRLKIFRAQQRPANDAKSSWKNQIGFINGELKFVRVSFLGSVQILKPVGTKMPVYQYMNRLVDNFKADAPAGLKSLFQEGGRIGWLWMRTELALVHGLVLGLAICFPIALLVLMMATLNWVLSFYATSLIGFIVLCVLGFCRLNGWDLGIAESIAGIIVIGFSVDYVVHLSHMYIEAGHKMGMVDRTQRFTYAAEKMGQTVIGGAITTAGSGIFMFFCQLTFFSKMAVLICVTILFSFLYSLGFFMSILALVGPEGNLGDLNAYFCKPATDAAKPRGAKVGADQEGGMEMVAAQPDA